MTARPTAGVLSLSLAVLLAALCSPPPSLSQTTDSLAVCDPSPQVEDGLKRLDAADDLPYAQRVPQQKDKLQDLLSQHPDDLFLLVREQDVPYHETQETRRAFVEKYQKLAASHPELLQYQYLYARSLYGIDTPRAIELYNATISKAGSYPWPYLGLAAIHSHGRFKDLKKAQEELDAFFDKCPRSVSEEGWSLLARIAGQPAAARYAPTLRRQLTADTDANHIFLWPTVWNLEFKATPVAGHADVRRQLTADLKRLDSGPRDESRLTALSEGYSMLDDKAATEALEQEWITKYPKSRKAQMILDDRWEKQHPYPKAADSEDKRKEFYNASLQRLNEQLKEMPDDASALMERMFILGEVYEMKQVPEQELLSAADAVLKIPSDSEARYGMPMELEVAELYASKQVRVDEVASLAARGTAEQKRREALFPDWLTDESRKSLANPDYLTVQNAHILAAAARDLHKPEIAKSAVTALADVDQTKLPQFYLWEIQGEYAEAEGRKLDALLLYRAAIDARPADAKPPGKDTLAEDESRLRKELGGTDATLSLWQKKTSEIAKGDLWEKPSKELPAWEMTDLEGKTWKLTSLQGKTVLVNVWASWCGPCREEHPFLQKLYERLKEKTDIQLITFNIDDEIGKIAPYMKEKGYTFPVLLAKAYMDDVFPSRGIPQNWILSSHGKWLWLETGFGTGEEWEGEVLKKLSASQEK